MMVHRLGRTILLDEFDVHSHLLRLEKVINPRFFLVKKKKEFILHILERLDMVSRFLS